MRQNQCSRSARICTLDEGWAKQVNAKFHQGGLDSRIITVDQEGTKRYRIAVTGFRSKEEAQEFSKSVTGKLGIQDTWIGHGRVFE